mmetsp:Transcript_59488/g.134216  ORF Transcript_59488/g.134216 Transcript_59488/m.134216 type:complete len:239 (-) Transcript_59488:211-927(-)
MLQVEGTPCIWVCTDGDVETAVAALQKVEAIAVDLEGDSLGHKGRAATIQLATLEACYVVDLAALGMPQSLRDLLQSDSPIKIGHGLTNDQINMIEQFNLDFGVAAIFDTQVAVENMHYSGKKGVVDILEAFSNIPRQVLTEMAAMKEQLRWVDFFKRPLPNQVARYICLDVIYLGSAFAAIRQQLDESTFSKILAESKYCGPYAKGSSYRPPTEQQCRRQAEKGKVWSDTKRDWVKR